MLARRLLSAAVGIPVLLLLLFVGGRVYDAALAAVLLVAVVELQLQAGSHLLSAPVWSAAIATAALSLLAPAGALGAGGFVLTVVAIAVLVYAAGRSGSRLGPWTLALLLLAYAGWLGQYLELLRHAAHGRALMLTAVLVTFASDSGAYFIGRAFGRRRLAPRLSPSKTMEGALAGLMAAAAATAILSRLLPLPVSLPVALAVGLALSLAAQLGDLLESALKRALEIKDAGTLIPGHGGLLDRLDSLLFVGAVLYYVTKWVSL